MGGYPAPADQAGLMRFVTGMRKWSDEVHIVHGDESVKRELAKSLRERIECNRCFIKKFIPKL